MKILAVNLYSNKQQIQSRPAFGDADEWPDDPWDAEKAKVHEKFSREFDNLEKQYERGEISQRRFYRERDDLFEWLAEQKEAITDKYRKMTINHLFEKKVEELPAKKPSFIKKLFQIK